MFPPDYHMHTPLCRHARGTPTDYARHALAVGLTEIGFSDHAPMPRDDFDDWRMRRDQLDEYVEGVRQAQEDVPEISIRLALEVDYLPGYEGWIRELASCHPWDYLIGSVHYVQEGWAIDHADHRGEWEQRDTWGIWAAYFDRLTQAAASGLFEVIGHPDLSKKFGHRPTRDCTPLFETFLASAKKSGCALDVNTAGLRKDCREIYPSLGFLRLACERGVPVTFGSDAHAPEEVGADFGVAMEHARRAGYRQSLRLVARRGELTVLG